MKCPMVKPIPQSIWLGRPHILANYPNLGPLYSCCLQVPTFLFIRIPRLPVHFIMASTTALPLNYELTDYRPLLRNRCSSHPKPISSSKPKGWIKSIHCHLISQLIGSLQDLKHCTLPKSPVRLLSGIIELKGQRKGALLITLELFYIEPLCSQLSVSMVTYAISN